MPELVWNETDFLVCLEVEPTIDEFECGYHYCVKKDGLRLELSVYQFSSDICITVYSEGVGRAIISFQITNCSGTKYIHDERGEWLEFAPSQVFGNRFSNDFVIPVGVRLSVRPSISVELFTS
jgi:hypothetical protein